MKAYRTKITAYPVTETEAQTIWGLIFSAVILFSFATMVLMALVFGGKEFYALAIPGFIAVVGGGYFLVSIRRIWKRVQKETTMVSGE